METFNERLAAIECNEIYRTPATPPKLSSDKTNFPK